MTQKEFHEQLVRLINKAREGEQIPLEELVGVIDQELEGLKMAEQEGEEY